MASRKKATGGVKGETKASLKNSTPTAIASKVSARVGRTRKGRDSVTRVSSPIKVADTNARQWNRYSP